MASSSVDKQKKANENISLLNLFASKGKQKPTEHKPATAASRIGGSSVVGKDDYFTVFNNDHAEEAAKIVQKLLDAPTYDEYIALATDLRDDLNENMYLYVVSVASSHRSDLKDSKFPPIFESRSRGFFRSKLLKEQKARAAADKLKLAGVDDGSTPIARSAAVPPPTASETPEAGAEEIPVEEVEECLDYWREDICLNSHHWHWHVVYPVFPPRDKVLDRRGELFFYMHRQMLARYDAERLSHGIAPVKPFDNWDEPVQGYDGELVGFGTRPPKQRVPDYAVVWLKDKTAQALLKIENETMTIDKFGAWVELHLHNGGHGIIGAMFGDVPQAPGVINYAETAIRDPMFFRWHKYVDFVIQLYKDKETPYEDAVLAWSDMEVEGVELLDKDHFVTNSLETFRRTTDVDLSYSVDLMTADEDGNKETVTHLIHHKFSYRFRVKNTTGKARWATVRVFLMPVLDENKQEHTMKDYTTKCIEMDRFTQKIDVGSRIFERSSSDSSVIIPWEQSFDVLYENLDRTPSEEFCGCGWPEHLQIPRGTPEGMLFKVVVMLTDWEKDKVNRDRKVPVNPDDQKPIIVDDNEEFKTCKNAASYCGRRDLLYPDKKDMGFPFDKPLKDEPLDSFIAGKRNFNYMNLTIKHSDKIVVE